MFIYFGYYSKQILVVFFSSTETDSVLSQKVPEKEQLKKKRFSIDFPVFFHGGEFFLR